MEQLIFPVINFFIFCGILFYALRAPVKSMFNNRSLDIEKSIEQALQAHIQSKTKHDEAQQKLQFFEKEKEKLYQETEEEMKFFYQKSKTELEALIERMKLESEQRTQEELKKALEEVKQTTAKKVVAMAERILREKLLEKEQEQLINEYLMEAEKNSSFIGRSEGKGIWQSGLH